MTRKIMLFAAALLLAGCDGGLTPAEQRSVVTQRSAADLAVTKWTDPDSGCRYLVFSRYEYSQAAVMAVAPKLRPDGSADCGR